MALITILLVGIVIISIIIRQNKYEEPKITIVSENQKGNKITEIFEIALPVKILSAFMYRDGGTIAVILEDNQKKEFEFCLDRRMREMKIEDLGKELEPYYFYIGSTYPEKEGSVKIPYAGEEEKELLKMLESWDYSNWEPKDKYDNTKVIILILIEELNERKK